MTVGVITELRFILLHARIQMNDKMYRKTFGVLVFLFQQQPFRTPHGWDLQEVAPIGGAHRRIVESVDDDRMRVRPAIPLEIVWNIHYLLPYYLSPPPPPHPNHCAASCLH